MKAVLISIQPKWCELIASGKKTVEVRKTKPKLETPFKVYIYCTNNKDKKIDSWLNLYCDSRKVSTDIKLEDDCYQLNGKVIGEFVCKKIHSIGKRGIPNNFDYCYLSLNVWGNDDIEIEITDIKKSCIPKNELNLYGEKSNCLYAWHISDLVIYDTPKELSEFFTVDNEAVKRCEHRERIYNNPDFTNGAMLLGSYLCNDKTDWCRKCKTKPLKRPPQSWCYVERLGEG